MPRIGLKITVPTSGEGGVDRFCWAAERVSLTERRPDARLAGGSTFF